ncbi:mind kinetochore complex component [Colletotrichum plurivorum]|uniref:Mind kinetochore complex component n=1 Tax=Colletotrichum plurivorum TaxID=2175906 RepID=A0A8H6KEB7_9PEZI|nr:mind kinetochore complex component [Colletotrichum plurivorum]
MPAPDRPESQPPAQQPNGEPQEPNQAAPAPDSNAQPEPESQQQPAAAAQQQPAPPASPPLPQKHTAVTPGPRATRFTQLYDLALQRTLQKVNYDNFASCFPTIAAHAPSKLRNVQKQMADYLEERCNKDFQAILVDRDVIRKLNELESLVSDAERRRRESGEDAEEPIPPHLLPPEEVMTAHLAPRLASQQSHLNARLQNTQAANEVLFASIQSQRAEIDALLAQLEGHVADIDGANALLVDVAPELAIEARDAEAQMSGM